VGNYHLPFVPHTLVWGFSFLTHEKTPCKFFVSYYDSKDGGEMMLANAVIGSLQDALKDTMSGISRNVRPNDLQAKVKSSLKNVLNGEIGALNKESKVASAPSSTKPSQVAEGTKSPDLKLTGLQYYQKLGVKAYANC
jgi:hypothetical protein